MIKPVPPASIFILGALLIPFLKGRLRQAYLLLVPVIAFFNLLSLTPGTSWNLHFLRYELILAEVNRLNLAVGYIFVVIGFLTLLYALHVKEDGHHMAAFLYMGSSSGAVFAGDFVSLFIFWEMMAISSVFLVWYRRSKESLDAGFRYLLMHLLGGSLLLTGLVIHILSEGAIAYAPLRSPWAYSFILAGFGLNAALIPLHTWLPDAYPLGTVTGSVFLSIFTTKTGIYVFARFFPGDVFLGYMGGAMALYGVLFALLQNDARKLLSYHIISQLGYMLAAIGVGTEQGLNASIAHLFNNNLFKPLLFMCMGSILYVTGKSKLTEMGGLARAMPVTCVTCLIASVSISGGPGFNGFVSKGMVIMAVSEAHQAILEWMLRLASVGTFLSFTKLCTFAFFGKAKKSTAQDPPFHMQCAMMATAFSCLLIGLYPKLLFDVLPYQPVDYHPYTVSHIVGVLQLFLLAGAVFKLAQRAFSPHEWIILDFDYFYRIAFRSIGWFCAGPLEGLRLRMQAAFSQRVSYFSHLSRNPFSLSEVAMKYVQSTRDRRTEASPALGETKERGYDENVYRNPMGLGVLIAILFLFLYGLIYFIKS
jgi:multicomponent Na+:H+ antiporter subunit D